MDGERCQVHFPGTFVLLTPHCRAKGQLTGPTVQQKKFPDCIIDVNHPLFLFHPPHHCWIQVDKSNVNVFCASKLWNAQALSTFPKAISEQEFIVPGTGGQAYEGRRNLTDAQETAQWLAGTEIAEAILRDLLGNSDFKNNCINAVSLFFLNNQTLEQMKSGDVSNTPVIIANCTQYDAFLERVCLKFGVPIVSQTDRQIVFQTATKLTKAKLLETWKANEAPLNKGVVKYKQEPEADTLPQDPESPNLKLCSLDDGVLILFWDVRSQFLTDPVRAGEWRRVLQEFDRCFGSVATENVEASAIANPDPEANSQNADVVLELPTEASSEWHARCDSKIKAKFNWCPEITAYLVEKTGSGDENALEDYELHIEATTEYTIGNDEAFLTYGAGSWLQDAKVDQFVDSAPPNHRGVICSFTSDSDLVVLEAGKSRGFDFSCLANNAKTSSLTDSGEWC